MSVRLTIKTIPDDNAKKIPTTQACDEGVTEKSNFSEKSGANKNPTTEAAIGNKKEIKPKIPF